MAPEDEDVAGYVRGSCRVPMTAEMTQLQAYFGLTSQLHQWIWRMEVINSEHYLAFLRGCLGLGVGKATTVIGEQRRSQGVTDQLPLD